MIKQTLLVVILFNIVLNFKDGPGFKKNHHGNMFGRKRHKNQQPIPGFEKPEVAFASPISTRPDEKIPFPNNFKPMVFPGPGNNEIPFQSAPMPMPMPPMIMPMPDQRNPFGRPVHPPRFGDHRKRHFRGKGNHPERHQRRRKCFLPGVLKFFLRLNPIFRMIDNIFQNHQRFKQMRRRHHQFKKHHKKFKELIPQLQQTNIQINQNLTHQKQIHGKTLGIERTINSDHSGLKEKVIDLIKGVKNWMFQTHPLNEAHKEQFKNTMNSLEQEHNKQQEYLNQQNQTFSNLKTPMSAISVLMNEAKQLATKLSFTKEAPLREAIINNFNALYEKMKLSSEKMEQSILKNILAINDKFIASMNTQSQDTKDLINLQEKLAEAHNQNIASTSNAAYNVVNQPVETKKEKSVIVQIEELLGILDKQN